MKNQLARASDMLTEETQETELGSSLFSRRYQEFVRRFEDKLCDEKVLSYLTNPGLRTSGIPNSKETIPFKEPGTRPEALLTRDSRTQDKFISLQKWEGVVIEVKGDSFLSRLYDLTEKGQEEEVELPLEEVSDGDRELVKPGAVFYWSIGYFDSRTGQRKRESIIRFRRLPAWRKEEIETAKSEAEHIRDLIGWK